MNQDYGKKHISAEFPEPSTSEITGRSPFFSIGVTTYNRPELLRQTLLSISRQTFTDFEVIVGNDFIPEPLTAELVGINDSRIRFENYPQNLGEERNMNTLLAMSRGRYFIWQCDDDLFSPEFLEEVFLTLTRFNFPPCVFSSYKLIYGTSFPDMPNILSGQGKNYSGRQFLSMYWSGRIKAIGCNGVYQRDYLLETGGVKCLADYHRPLYSEHLLLNQAGLQKQVAHIDEPLVLYRVHDDAWGCRTNDLSVYKQAGNNLIHDSIIIFLNPELRDDFRQNMAYLLNFVISEYVDMIKSDTGLLSRFKAVPFFFSLKEQFESLRGTPFFLKALISWAWAGIKLVWRLGTDFNLKALYSFFGRFKQDWLQ
ncbi:MAG: glycosyltransferase family 2 protein [Desulfobacteraceae bacterium]|nr:glycosyltransferase family 2 protein [Desulfobacteraceae bacterium]